MITKIRLHVICTLTTFVFIATSPLTHLLAYDWNSWLKPISRLSVRDMEELDAYLQRASTKGCKLWWARAGLIAALHSRGLHRGRSSHIPTHAQAYAKGFDIGQTYVHAARFVNQRTLTVDDAIDFWCDVAVLRVGAPSYHDAEAFEAELVAKLGTGHVIRRPEQRRKVTRTYVADPKGNSTHSGAEAIRGRRPVVDEGGVSARKRSCGVSADTANSSDPHTLTGGATSHTVGGRTALEMTDKSRTANVDRATFSDTGDEPLEERRPSSPLSPRAPANHDGDIDEGSGGDVASEHASASDSGEDEHEGDDVAIEAAAKRSAVITPVGNVNEGTSDTQHTNEEAREERRPSSPLSPRAPANHDGDIDEGSGGDVASEHASASDSGEDEHEGDDVAIEAAAQRSAVITPVGNVNEGTSDTQHTNEEAREERRPSSPLSPRAPANHDGDIDEGSGGDVASEHASASDSDEDEREDDINIDADGSAESGDDEEAMPGNLEKFLEVLRDAGHDDDDAGTRQDTIDALELVRAPMNTDARAGIHNNETDGATTVHEIPDHIRRADEPQRTHIVATTGPVAAGVGSEQLRFPERQLAIPSSVVITPVGDVNEGASDTQLTSEAVREERRPSSPLSPHAPANHDGDIDEGSGEDDENDGHAPTSDADEDKRKDDINIGAAAAPRSTVITPVGVGGGHGITIMDNGPQAEARTREGSDGGVSNEQCADADATFADASRRGHDADTDELVASLRGRISSLERERASILACWQNLAELSRAVRPTAGGLLDPHEGELGHEREGASTFTRIDEAGSRGETNGNPSAGASVDRSNQTATADLIEENNRLRAENAMLQEESNEFQQTMDGFGALLDHVMRARDDMPAAELRAEIKALLDDGDAADEDDNDGDNGGDGGDDEDAHSEDNEMTEPDE